MFLLNSKGKIPIMVIIVAVLVICIAAGTFAFVGKSKVKSKKEAETTQWKLNEFIVNMADIDTPRYLKATIVLAIQGADGKAAKIEAGNPMEAEARDTIISIMTRKHYAELLTEKGREALKQDIKKGLNARLNGIKIVDVYFTDFAMQ